MNTDMCSNTFALDLQDGKMKIIVNEGKKAKEVSENSRIRIFPHFPLSFIPILSERLPSYGSSWL